MLTLVPQLMALKDSVSAPVVRPPSNDVVVIKRLLDAGFHNFLIPFVESADEARRAVASTRYPPAGVRGVSVSQRSNRYGTVPDYFKVVNDNIAVMVQIESRAGVAAAADIAAVEGIDGLFIGPSDLAAGFGHLGNANHPEVQQAMSSVMAPPRRRASRWASSPRSRPTQGAISRWAPRLSPWGATWESCGWPRRRCSTSFAGRTRPDRRPILNEHHSKEQAMNVGFIGLGIMGTPMAANLIKGGHRLFLYSIPSIPQALVDAGAVACASGKEVAQKADIIITMVPDTPHVDAALFGENGVASGLAKGKIVVDMSSISPLATKEFARKINALGCEYLDAPVSGGEVGAKAASLTIMVGGSEATFAQVKPLFELMGKNITLVGGNGDGQTTKVANQIIVALTIEAVGEALLYASKAGADPAKVRQALMGGFASSRILEVHGERMVKRTFDPGFRIELHQKDLNLALSTGRQLGVALPNTATCQELFNACAAHGGSAWDHSAMVRALERHGEFRDRTEGRNGTASRERRNETRAEARVLL